MSSFVIQNQNHSQYKKSKCKALGLKGRLGTTRIGTVPQMISNMDRKSSHYAPSSSWKKYKPVIFPCDVADKNSTLSVLFEF